MSEKFTTRALCDEEIDKIEQITFDLEEIEKATTTFYAERNSRATGNHSHAMRGRLLENDGTAKR